MAKMGSVEYVPPHRNGYWYFIKKIGGYRYLKQDTVKQMHFYVTGSQSFLPSKSLVKEVLHLSSLQTMFVHL